ncbi:hypothetical protein HA402_005344 [Bradysia odoriphaga]|nr:hypothetical protein HA402_005344 [Bradysia odoriphaga]
MFNMLQWILRIMQCIRVYLENEHPFSPTEFLADLEAKGIDPNHVTYQRPISRYCQEGDMDGATKILEFMREIQLPINENVFSSLIMGHSAAGHLQSCQECVTVLGKTVNDFVDKIIPRLQKSSGYNQHAASLILRLVNIRQEDTALKILKTMPRGTKPNGELYEIGCSFIRQLVKSGRPTEKILSICGELQQAGLHHRAILIAVEMGAKSGKLDVAVPLFRELQQYELPVQQYYFWPLLWAGGKFGTDTILDVIIRNTSKIASVPNSSLNSI